MIPRISLDMVVSTEISAITRNQTPILPLLTERLLVNSFKERTTYNLNNLSFPPLTTLNPSGDQSTANTSSEWPGRSSSNLCVFMFHTAIQTHRMCQLTFAGSMSETASRQDMVSHKSDEQSPDNNSLTDRLQRADPFLRK